MGIQMPHQTKGFGTRPVGCRCARRSMNPTQVGDMRLADSALQPTRIGRRNSRQTKVVPNTVGRVEKV